MKKAAIYVRSSKDLHNVSCASQEQQIKKVVKDNGEKIFGVFCDKALSSTRDVRDDFEKMIDLATSKQPPFDKIYCLDTSRFGRDQHQTQLLLWTLRKKHAIEVEFINMPKAEKYMSEFLENIMTSVDQLHSTQSKIKGVASMKQNVRDGFRAGGQAPYGYR
ncbi:recombinase family protein, partial [Thermodesulfobacteriota bacterium]